jgi:8-oxo-dGTP pyrophosphatase MutT (NUDIX family)
MPGPTIRTDIVEIYVFRRASPAMVGAGQQQGVLAVEFLQLRRAKGLMVGGWHPVMGHVEVGETAAQTALREMAEETRYAPGRGLTGFWQLELVNNYYIASIDAVILSPGFAAEVAPGMEPTIDDAHDGVRWVARDQADRSFLWPGQRRAVDHVVSDILPAGSPMAKLLRIEI